MSHHPHTDLDLDLDLDVDLALDGNLDWNVLKIDTSARDWLEVRLLGVSSLVCSACQTRLGITS